MELLYVDNIIIERQYYDEFYYFILNYIIGEKVDIHSNIGFYIYCMKNIDKVNAEELTKYAESNFIFESKVYETDISDFLESVDLVRNNTKKINNFKRFKMLPKGEFGFVAAHNKLLRTIKEVLYDSSKISLINLNIFQYLDLCNDGIIKLNYSIYDRLIEINDYEIGEKIYNLLKTRESLLVINDISKVLKEFDRFAKYEKKHEKKKSIYNHLIVPLLTIPCSRNLTLNDLIILRKAFQLKFASLISKIQIFRIEVNQLKLNKEIKIKIKEFNKRIKTELKSLQADIDNNIYIMKIKNSDAEYINVKVNLGLTTNEFILHLYSFKYVLTSNKTRELKNRLDEYIGDDLTEVYLSYEIEPKINEIVKTYE